MVIKLLYRQKLLGTKTIANGINMTENKVRNMEKSLEKISWNSI